LYLNLIALIGNTIILW